MKSVVWRGAACAASLVGALLLAGCNTLGAPDAPAAVAGAGAATPGAKPVKLADAKPADVKPADRAPDGVLAGAFGSKLAESERKTAFSSQLDALSTGQRKTWRGAPGGAYGYIEPGVESTGAAGACRSYAHTIYFAGRPQSASGQACRGADGTWRAAG